MAAGGGNAERVTFSGGYNISPAVSPDGRTLAYVTRAGNAFRLVVLDLSTPGAQPQMITDTNDDEHPSFAPNGRLLIYATSAQGRSVLMTTTLDGKIKARLPSADGRSARAGVGPVRALVAEPPRRISASKGRSHEHLPSPPPHRPRRRLAGGLLERQARRPGAGRVAHRRERRPGQRRRRAPAPAARRRGSRRSTSRRPRNAAYSNLPRIVYFDFDSYVVKDDYRPVIEANAKALSGQPQDAHGGRGPHRRPRQQRIQPRPRPAPRRGGGQVADAARRRARPSSRR